MNVLNALWAKITCSLMRARNDDRGQGTTEYAILVGVQVNHDSVLTFDQENQRRSYSLNIILRRRS